MPIYNCHSHIFTIDHVPNHFLNRDLFHRYANLARLSDKKSQRELFEVMRSYYPADTRFVILPMGMAFYNEINTRHHQCNARKRDIFLN